MADTSLFADCLFALACYAHSSPLARNAVVRAGRPLLAQCDPRNRLLCIRRLADDLDGTCKACHGFQADVHSLQPDMSARSTTSSRDIFVPRARSAFEVDEATRLEVEESERIFRRPSREILGVETPELFSADPLGLQPRLSRAQYRQNRSRKN
ncbi:unnamed protein product [Symbiodinium sp. CCMP2592]|nr:unnamed protein product [Symbiodinium sp. CCMP2592]